MKMAASQKQLLIHIVWNCNKRDAFAIAKKLAEMSSKWPINVYVFWEKGY